MLSVSDRKLAILPSFSPRAQHLTFLDGIRGLAAFYVMVFHARWLLWEGFANGFLTHPEQYPFWAKGLTYVLLLFTYGHQMVLMFFVLSGFLIHLRYARQFMQQPFPRFEWKQYAWRRIKRLYPPLIFTMLFTFALDQLGARLGFQIYGGITILNLDIRPDHSWPTAFENLIFVMGIYGVPWGMNGALWSLAYEAWFYILYPIFWCITKKSIGLATAIIVIMFVLSFFPDVLFLKLFQVVFSLMLSWWFGVLLADIYVGRIKIHLWKLAPLSLLVFVLAPVTYLIPVQTPAAQVVEDTLWAVTFIGVLAGCMSWQNRNYTGIANLPLKLLERLKPLGEMSYTLYVIHFPILIFISGWLMWQSPTHTLPHELGWIFFGCVVCLGVAYVAHFVAEKPFISNKKTEVTNTRDSG